MTTANQTGTTTVKTRETRAARRASAQAQLDAVDAEQRAAHAAAEAQWATQEAARRDGAVRTAALSAELDELDAWAKQRRQDELDQVRRDVERRADLMQQVRTLAKEPLPHVRSSMDEHRAALADLGKYVDARVQAEQDQLRREMDACESRRLWDYDFRQSFDRRHAREGCDCPGHRAWRREEP